jgi:hypothetical protein
MDPKEGETGTFIEDDDEEEEEGGGAGGATPHRSDTSNTPFVFPAS